MANLIFSVLPQPRRPIAFVNPQTSVDQCIKIMTTQDIGALVVIDENDKLIGMVTERDIVRSGLLQGLDLSKATAADIVYTSVSVLNLFDPIEEAMEVITQTKRRYVLVADKDELVAILSIGDLLYYLLEDKMRVIEQLENYIHTY